MSQELFYALGQELASTADVKPGKMFGKECLMLGKKAFAAYHLERMVFRLGREYIDSMEHPLTGSECWDPSGKGRAMKDWLAVSTEHVGQWKSLAMDALAYTESLP